MNTPPPKKKKKATRSRSGTISDRSAIESLVGPLVALEHSGPLEQAQDIMWDAFDAPDRRQRVALAKKALKLSPLCADAYVVLAQETAENVTEALEFYRNGVEAGEKALGKAAFRDNVGHFWGILETRPYMRARRGLAQSLWEGAAREEAVAHFQDLLRLNPGDNQGIRYILLDCLLTMGRDDEAGKLLRRYKNDGAAAWQWSQALATFRREGDSPQSRKALALAVRSNGHVSSYLLENRKLPRGLPDLISTGGEDEAIAYVANATPAWRAAPGALAWVKDVLS
ncbi:MAG TPA: tetratricopeptide repeat protein [Rhizomicrobium sp.]|jgi:tetratricopeptide (TPR) repeat protein|nr:tetratricopeptide repeat protein [Rhizomicrobium sp.]